MIQDHPILSVVTPSFNSARFITETLDSVAALPVPHEHLVIDGGSTDGTIEILENRNDDSLRWISEPDRGQTEAVNKGLTRAQGELVAWLNADDAYVVEGVTEAVAAFAADPRVDAVFGFTDIIDSAGQTTRQYRCGRFNWARFLYAGDFVPTPTIIFRRSLIDRAGLLDENYADAADYDFYLRLFRGARVRRIPRTLVRFRIHEGSKTGSNIGLQMSEAMEIRLKYAHGPLRRGLMLGIGRLKSARERARPFWHEAEDWLED